MRGERGEKEGRERGEKGEREGRERGREGRERGEGGERKFRVYVVSIHINELEDRGFKSCSIKMVAYKSVFPKQNLLMAGRLVSWRHIKIRDTNTAIA